MLDELKSDFYEINMHMLRHEYKEAAEIMAFYVRTGSTHPKVKEMPIEKALQLFLKGLPSEFPNFDSYMQFLDKFIALANEGRFFDPSFLLN